VGPGAEAVTVDHFDDAALARSLSELADGLAPHGQVGPLSSQLSAVVTAAARLLDVDCVGLLLLDDTDRIRSVAATGPAAEALEVAQEKVQVGPGVDAVVRQATVAVADVAAEPRYAELWREISGSGVRAVLSAPVQVGEQVVGNLNAVVADCHVWSVRQCRSAEAIGGIVGQLLGLAALGGAAEAGRDGRGPDR
jgi:transcriptional regulator with GAF, ATPase, and Fis domain